MLSVTTEHALRALICMAQMPQGTSLLGRQLAEHASIPATYLSKILLALRNAGYLQTTRGHGGGYRLCKPADEIRLIDIVDVFEGVRARPGCLLGEKHACSDATPCSAHGKWKEVRLAYMNFLESNTLADLAQNAVRAAR